MVRRLLFFAALLLSLLCSAIDASNQYRSPRNPERAVRKSTELIILHTTEAPARSSLNKLSDRGECHFCVTEEGRIYRIIDRDKEAFHAGRSMWNGKEDVDKFSIGIECVGYHDKAMSAVQLAAIRDLVAELKSMYHLSDDKVIAHSHVAYGMPNKWQKKKHRGRKRCGMLFAMPSVREALNLKSKPKVDQDVKARRLVIGDDYLARVLYGNIDTMKAKIQALRMAKPKPAEPASKGWFDWMKFGSSKKSSEQVVTKTVKKTEPTVTKKTAVTSTQSFAPPKTLAELKRLPGYAERGKVMPGRTAVMIAGDKWNKPDTYYVIRDKVIPGNKLDPKKIEKGMAVWFKK